MVIERIFVLAREDAPVNEKAISLFSSQSEFTHGQTFATELLAQTILPTATEFVSQLEPDEADYLWWELAVRGAEPQTQVRLGETVNPEDLASHVAQYVVGCVGSLQPAPTHSDEVLHNLQLALQDGPTDSGTTIKITTETEAAHRAEQLAQYQLFALVVTVLALRHAIENKQVHAKLSNNVRQQILGIFDAETQPGQAAKSDHRGRSLAEIVLRNYDEQYHRPHARHTNRRFRQKSKQLQSKDEAA
ncbi:MAG TPA: hypothetical protein VMY99_04735 [Nevskiaceae bacterium]|nr:hypothetical protein [Nevskiaceae bacterium]